MTNYDKADRRSQRLFLPAAVVLLRVLQVTIGLIASYYYLFNGVTSVWTSQPALLGAAASVLLLFASIALTSRIQRRITQD